MPPRYRNWLTHVFDHPVRDPAWFFDANAPYFDAPSDELVELITYTFLNCGRDLVSYSDGQVNDGLNYIFNNACSNVVFSLMDSTVSLESRKRAIASIKELYAQCFEERCAPVLGHLDEAGAKPLNHICYMLWDVTPLSYWEADKSKDVFYGEVLSVLQYALGSPNPACVESALHGLGHIQLYRASQVTPIIQAFLRRNAKLRPELRQYAENAAVGCVL
jgi:hypothetical protein